MSSRFREEFHYRFLGDGSDPAGNGNSKTDLLSDHPLHAGYSSGEIAHASDLLKREADNYGSGLFANNEGFYRLLYPGVKAKIDVGEMTETVRLVDWDCQ